MLLLTHSNPKTARISSEHTYIFSAVSFTYSNVRTKTQQTPVKIKKNLNCHGSLYYSNAEVLKPVLYFLCLLLLTPQTCARHFEHNKP